MDIKIQYIRINNRVYKLVHPGIRHYLEAKKRFTYVATTVDNTDEMILQIDSVKLYDYSFGKKPSDQRVVHACNSKGSSFVDWTHETSAPTEWAPTFDELGEVWSVLLPQFLDFKLKEDFTVIGHKVKVLPDYNEVSAAPKGNS